MASIGKLGAGEDKEHDAKASQHHRLVSVDTKVSEVPGVRSVRAQPCELYPFLSGLPFLTWRAEFVTAGNGMRILDLALGRGIFGPPLTFDVCLSCSIMLTSNSKIQTH